MAIRLAAVVGTGAVGAALAGNLVRTGSTCDCEPGHRQDAEVAIASGTVSVPSKPKRSVRGVEVVFLAVPPDAATAVLEEARRSGAMIVDCTNPMTWDAGPVHAPPEEGSITAQLARRFPSARLVKAFNTFGAEFHADPKLGTTTADVFLAGDDAEAKKTVSELARTLGYEPVDVGPLRNARHLESLAMLWIHLATVGGKTRDVAFKLLHR